jgi:hypothetical protein
MGILDQPNSDGSAPVLGPHRRSERRFVSAVQPSPALSGAVGRGEDRSGWKIVPGGSRSAPLSSVSAAAAEMGPDQEARETDQLAFARSVVGVRTV